MNNCPLPSGNPPKDPFPSEWQELLEGSPTVNRVLPIKMSKRVKCKGSMLILIKGGHFIQLCHSIKIEKLFYFPDSFICILI